MADISKITVPVLVEGSLVNTTFDIKDAGARQLINDLGNAVYWIGVTTNALTDGDTTNPITVNSESVTVKVGGMAQYSGEEFVWNGSAWQSIGKNNFGALAFKSSASGNFTPAGSVTSEITGGTNATVNSITAVGTLPSFSVSGETLTYTPGTLPTKGDDTSVVTATGTVSSTFSGTQGSVTVE